MSRYPSIKSLQTKLKLCSDHAHQVRNAMIRNNGLAVYNRIANLHGVETILLPDGCADSCTTPDLVIRYANAGETYTTTLMKVNGRYVIGNWGHYAEKYL